MKLSSASREFLSLAYHAQDWLDLYDLHDRYLIAPGQISTLARKMEQLALLEIDEARVRLTRKGRIWVIQNRHAIFMGGRGRPWVTRPSWVAVPPIEPKRPYLPQRSKIDARFFRDQ